MIGDELAADERQIEKAIKKKEAAAGTDSKLRSDFKLKRKPNSIYLFARSDQEEKSQDQAMFALDRTVSRQKTEAKRGLQSCFVFFKGSRWFGALGLLRLQLTQISLSVSLNFFR